MFDVKNVDKAEKHEGDPKREPYEELNAGVRFRAEICAGKIYHRLLLLRAIHCRCVVGSIVVSDDAYLAKDVQGVEDHTHIIVG